MAKAVFASITISYWKEHRCLACGGGFQYKMSKELQGSGETEQSARYSLDVATQVELSTSVSNRPCPHCGAIQPDIASNTRYPTFQLLVIGLAVALAAGGLCTYGPAVLWLSYPLSSAILAALSLVAVATYWIFTVRDPNRNPAANLTRAEQLIREGELQATSAPSESSHGGIPRFQLRGAKLWITLACLGFLITWAPLVVKSAFGWKSNSNLKPEVAGPGDTIMQYFGNKFETLGGMCARIPRGKLTDQDGKVYPVGGTGNSPNWGTSTKKELKAVNLYGEFRLPNDPALAGQTVKLDLELNLEFPVLAGENNFTTRRDVANFSRQLTLSEPGAKVKYQIALAIAGFGAFLVTLAGILLLIQLSANCKLTTVITTHPIGDHEPKERPWKQRDGGPEKPNADD